MSGGGTVGKNCLWNVRDGTVPWEVHARLRAAAMICDTLVNTHSHRQTDRQTDADRHAAFDRLLLAQPAELTITYTQLSLRWPRSLAEFEFSLSSAGIRISL